MIIDFIKNAIKNIRRNKKNKTLILIFTLLLFLLYVDIVIIKSFYEYYDYAINRNVGFRTLTVYHPTLSQEEAIVELKKIQHVSEVYEGIYASTTVQSDITDNGCNGWIGLIYGTKNTAPASIKGKNINELSKGELICPYEFYPDSRYGNPLDIDESKFLYEDSTLNRDVVLNYSLVKSNVVDNQWIEEKEEMTKTMKIVGLYDETIFRNGINVCYASLEDIKDIANAYNPPLEDFNYYPLHVIVDEEKNVKEVYKSILNLNKFEVNKDTVAYIDKGFVSVLFSITFIFAIIIMMSILLLLKNYINKKIKSESKYLGILRSCGYTKYQVILQEIIENSIVLCMSFLISASLFSVLFVFLDSKIFKYFKYIGFNIHNNILMLFIVFFMIIIIAESINYYLVKKKIDNPISNIIMED